MSHVKASSLVAVLLLAVASVGARCGKPSRFYSKDSGQVLLRVKTKLADAPPVVIHQMRNSYTMDCSSWYAAKFPEKELNRFFGPGFSIHATAGNPVVRMLNSKSCGLLLVEQPGFKPKVLSYSTTGEIELSVTQDGVTGQTEFSLYDAGERRSEPAFNWNKPAVLGVALRVEAISETADCYRLGLAAALAQSNTRFEWELCPGGTALPFAMGDLITVDCPSPEKNCRDALRIVATVASNKSAAGQRVTLWLADMSAESFREWRDKPSVLSDITVSLSGGAGQCRSVIEPGCTALHCDGSASVNLGGRSVSLNAGESTTRRVKNGAPIKVQILNASLWPLRSANCDQPKGWIKLAAIERQDRARRVTLAK